MVAAVGAAGAAPCADPERLPARARLAQSLAKEKEALEGSIRALTEAAPAPPPPPPPPDAGPTHPLQEEAAAGEDAADPRMATLARSLATLAAEKARMESDYRRVRAQCQRGLDGWLHPDGSVRGAGRTRRPS